MNYGLENRWTRSPSRPGFWSPRGSPYAARPRYDGHSPCRTETPGTLTHADMPLTGVPCLPVQQ